MGAMLPGWKASGRQWSIGSCATGQIVVHLRQVRPICVAYLYIRPRLGQSCSNTQVGLCFICTVQYAQQMHDIYPSLRGERIRGPSPISHHWARSPQLYPCRHSKAALVVWVYRELSMRNTWLNKVERTCGREALLSTLGISSYVQELS
jgi:hypothetical protein